MSDSSSPAMLDRSAPADKTTSPVKADQPRKSPAISVPWNYLRFIWEFTILCIQLPYHFFKFALFPSTRPRRSWTLLESTLVPATRSFMGAMDMCGFKISTRDATAEPFAGWPLRLKGVEFEWVEKIPDDLFAGIIDDGFVAQMDRVGMFNWWRQSVKDLVKGNGSDEKGGLVGLYFHGGAYMHNSAHPRSPSSAIIKTLFEREPRFASVHTVEYRLLPGTPFPGALQDCAAAYISLLRRGVKGHQIVLIGDSSGGHLALSLSRWAKDTLKSGKGELRDDCLEVAGVEKRPWRMEEPAGLMLFSPWTDPSHSFLNSTPETYVPRRNDCDYIFEKGPFRHHLVQNLLGQHEKEFILSPYMSPGAPSQPASIFDGFPPCFVHYGTGERCMDEGIRLVGKLRDAGVRVEEVVTEDTPHDLILLATVWRKKQINQIWDGAFKFVASLRVN
ncbi:hypothetical protein JCM11641_007265 [Rhodosporidiobolus odoratus]